MMMMQKVRQMMTTDQYFVSGNFQQQVGNRNNLLLFKSLLQPHFLFNSLNNLYALSLKNSDKMPVAIFCLSHLLERVVSYARMDMISLSEEIAFIEDYIALERIWLGEYAFLMDFQVKGDMEGVSVPPLTIYTFIENAFKHGIRKCSHQGWITIHLIVKKDKILLKVRNPFLPVADEDHCERLSQTGFGMKAVRALLECSYKKKYYLDARFIGKVYAVDLIMSRVAA